MNRPERANCLLAFTCREQPVNLGRKISVRPRLLYFCLEAWRGCKRVGGATGKKRETGSGFFSLARFLDFARRHFPAE